MSRRIPTAAELGLMRGSPPAADRLVTLDNWQDPPFNRWGFQHVRDLIPTAKIGRGEGPAWSCRARNATSRRARPGGAAPHDASRVCWRTPTPTGCWCCTGARS